MDRANIILAPIPLCLCKSILTDTRHSSLARVWKWGILRRRSWPALYDPWAAYLSLYLLYSFGALYDQI